MKTVLPFLALLVIVPAGCAAKDDTGSHPSSNVLTVEEIQDVPVTSAYDVVRRLRPHWLRFRSVSTPGRPRGQRPVVYVDGVRSGSVGILRNLPREDVTRMEYLDPTDATNRYGTDHSAGAIRVTTG